MRSLSSRALQALAAEYTEEVFLHLLEINHDQLAAPIRVVNNFEDIISNGDTYIAFPFDISLPEDSDTLPQVVLTIDNVDRSITEALRPIATPPTISLILVLANTPDVVEAGPITFQLRSIDFDLHQVTGTLMPKDVLNAPFPYQTFSPSSHPSLFKVAG